MNIRVSLVHQQFICNCVQMIAFVLINKSFFVLLQMYDDLPASDLLQVQSNAAATMFISRISRMFWTTIFNHMINKLILEIQEDLKYPIHILFSSADDFNADLVLIEIDRIVSSNESFDISNNIKVNVLRVSLPTMGGKRNTEQNDSRYQIAYQAKEVDYCDQKWKH